MPETNHTHGYFAEATRFVVLIAALAGVCGAESMTFGPITSVFDPHSPNADSVVHLSHLVLAITGFVFAVVSGLLLYALIAFRGRKASAGREPAPVYGSTQIEMAWTIIPTLLVLVMVVATARVIHAIEDAPKPDNAVEVIAIGHQFWWEFRYPQLGIVTANELHMPVSDPARPRPTFLKLTSADTDHSFWIPQLGGKTDLIPNRVNTMWFGPRETGIYLGQCAQYCGTQHAKMLLRVSVDSSDDFAAWARSQQQPAAHDEAVASGRRIFETTACVNCHTVTGTNANGRFGPDLTHLMSRATIAAGAAPNTDEKLRLWIQTPDAIKPGSLMPAMQLNEADTDALVRYLETLK